MQTPTRRQALDGATAVRERLARTDDSHVRILNAFVAELGRSHQGVPFFDPDGGGVRAGVLLLLSDPGPKGARQTGIVSVDNQDKTALNLTRMLSAANLDPSTCVNWNVVPWATNRPTAEIGGWSWQWADEPRWAGHSWRATIQGCGPTRPGTLLSEGAQSMSVKSLRPWP